jgi:hypothetical protein
VVDPGQESPAGLRLSEQPLGDLPAGPVERPAGPPSGWAPPLLAAPLAGLEGKDLKSGQTRGRGLGAGVVNADEELELVHARLRTFACCGWLTQQPVGPALCAIRGRDQLQP